MTSRFFPHTKGLCQCSWTCALSRFWMCIPSVRTEYHYPLIAFAREFNAFALGRRYSFSQGDSPPLPIMLDPAQFKKFSLKTTMHFGVLGCVPGAGEGGVAWSWWMCWMKLLGVVLSRWGSTFSCSHLFALGCQVGVIVASRCLPLLSSNLWGALSLCIFI